VNELHPNGIADIEPLEATHDSSFHGWPGDPYPRPLLRRARHNGIELRTDARCKKQCGGGLAHLPLHLRRIVLLLGAMACQRHELVVGVRRRAARERRLQQALRNQIRKAPVRRGRMGVIIDRKTEVSLRRVTGQLEHVLARAQELDD